MKFEDITEIAKVSGGEEWTAGATLVDIDADGDLDIHACNYDAPNALFINDGKGGLFRPGRRVWPGNIGCEFDGVLL